MEGCGADFGGVQNCTRISGLTVSKECVYGLLTEENFRQHFATRLPAIPRNIQNSKNDVLQEEFEWRGQAAIKLI